MTVSVVLAWQLGGFVTVASSRATGCGRASKRDAYSTNRSMTVSVVLAWIGWFRDCREFPGDGLWRGRASETLALRTVSPLH
jgi:hypothetical protein